jgi:hypothetical protein
MTKLLDDSEKHLEEVEFDRRVSLQLEEHGFLEETKLRLLNKEQLTAEDLEWIEKWEKVPIFSDDEFWE